MAMIDTPQLSSFQLGLLEDLAASPVPITLVAVPKDSDPQATRVKLYEELAAIVNLVGLELIDCVDEEFDEFIQEHRERTGRQYKVYGLSGIGSQLFQPVPQVIN